MADRILKSVRILKLPHGQSEVSDHVTISIGIATAAPALAGRAPDLVKIADKALGKAKQKGRNQIAYMSTLGFEIREQMSAGREIAVVSVG